MDPQKPNTFLVIKERRLPTKLAALMGSLLAHARGVSLMFSLSQEASILRVYIIMNVENMSGALLLKGAEDFHHVTVKLGQ